MPKIKETGHTKHQWECRKVELSYTIGGNAKGYILGSILVVSEKYKRRKKKMSENYIVTFIEDLRKCKLLTVT